MNKKSLQALRDVIIMVLNDYELEDLEPFIERLRKIDKLEKGELSINSYHFFSPERYDENINVLRNNEKVFKKLYEKEHISTFNE